MATKIVDTFYNAHAKAVKRGVRLLDKVRRGWEKEIDLSNLELSDPTSCMLGQLYGDFSEGKDELSTALREARVRFEESQYQGRVLDDEYYGFEAQLWDDETVNASRSRGYSILNELWTAVVEQRRSKDVQAERKRRAGTVR